MDSRSIVLVGAPVDDGGARRGCLMGADALRVAGLADALDGPRPCRRGPGQCRRSAGRQPKAHANGAIHHLAECGAWIEALSEAAYEVSGRGRTAVFLGGDHLMSAGTVAGPRAPRAGGGPSAVRPLARRPHRFPRPRHDRKRQSARHSGGLFHRSGAAFDGYFPALPAAVPPANVTMLGIRSVDPAERVRVVEAGVSVVDMRPDRRGGDRPAAGAVSRQGRGIERAAPRQLRRRFHRTVDRAGRRHDGSRRRHLPRSASGLRDAARQRPGELPRSCRTQSVPRRARPHREADGRSRREPVRQARHGPPDKELLTMYQDRREKLNIVPFVSVENMMKIVLAVGVERFMVGTRRLHRGGLRPLGAFRQGSAHRRAFGRRRHRTDADERRRDLWLQIRQRPSEEHARRAADGDGLRGALERRYRLSAAPVGNDDPDGAAHGGDLGDGREVSRAGRIEDDGDHRQRRAVGVPGAGLQGARRHRPAEALRRRSRCDRANACAI